EPGLFRGRQMAALGNRADRAGADSGRRENGRFAAWRAAGPAVLPARVLLPDRARPDARAHRDAPARRAAAGALADAGRAHSLRGDASCDVSAAGSDARARLAGAVGLWPAPRLLRAVRAAGLARQGRAAVKAAVLRARRRRFFARGADHAASSRRRA